MKACQFITILAALIFTSCENNDDLVLNNQLELTYSYSPIPLGDIDAKFSKDISYGPDSRNTFDIFLPDGTGLLEFAWEELKISIELRSASI